MWRSPGLPRALIGYGLLAAASLGLPLLTRDSYYIDVATTILMNLVLTMSLRLEMSTGQLNMAHISFMGIGAYASTLLVMRGGYSFWVTLWLAGLAAAAFALPIGSLALRVSGVYYFLISFAFSEVVRLVFNNFFVGWFGGPSGLVQIPKPDPLHLGGLRLTFVGKVELYYVMCVLLLLAAAVLVRLDYSRFGLLANAIRQSDLLAETVGVWVFRYKLVAFVLGSFMAGLAGAFFAHSHQVLHSSDFGLEPMVLLVIFTVIGGTGNVWGPVAGTVALTIISEFMREFHYYEILLYGAVLILTMLLLPEGLISLPGRLGRHRRRERPEETEAMGAGVAP
ncbi:MAG: branched-chain amino acid ABC transporter permease [Candidatus Rokubacteria bacterium]|nr:branched-chain amino acid ABC transporter permease [Candidatus Rokubacteria bacterium]